MPSPPRQRWMGSRHRLLRAPSRWPSGEATQEVVRRAGDPIDLMAATATNSPATEPRPSGGTDFGV